MMLALLYIVFWLAGLGGAIGGVLARIGYGSDWQIEIKFVPKEELRRIQ